MSDDTMLPDDDRDLSLARRLGAQLEKRAPLDHAAEDEAYEDASFYGALLSFKRDQEKAQPAMPAETSERIWAALEQRIAQDQAAPEPRPALGGGRRAHRPPQPHELVQPRCAISSGRPRRPA